MKHKLPPRGSQWPRYVVGGAPQCLSEQTASPATSPVGRYMLIMSRRSPVGHGGGPRAVETGGLTLGSDFTRDPKVPPSVPDTGDTPELWCW
ncbi:hypothetical protein EYF80_032956 [Liparis tanakae]|uniref:Uncharacterized protein n=1 Tax=Liparis tanakae TaxID=230148 RepID=A0A4Z2GUF9_9TELE|nr:hypothetical protein EYF80_032956 [Liparis tanakae]